MITPLELAELLEEGPRRAGDAFIASELRRLAQVEAEHEALKKAISEAEPAHYRAMLADDQIAHQLKPTMHVVGIREKQAADAFIEEQKTFYGWNYTLEPLYTLEGIRK